MIELSTMTQAGYTPPQTGMPPKQRPPKKPKKSKKRKKGISAAGVVSLIVFLIAVLIGSCTLFLYAQTAPYTDTFLPGTTVSGYALGGLTAQEGAAVKLVDENGETAQVVSEDTYDAVAQIVYVGVQQRN